MSWLTKGTGSYKASLEKQKDDQGGTRNPYKCMNVMKQDATDDKVIEGWKHVKKKTHKKKNVMLIDSKHTHTKQV